LLRLASDAGALELEKIRMAGKEPYPFDGFQEPSMSGKPTREERKREEEALRESEEP